MTSWIEKQRSLVDFALSSILRRKGKNLSLLIVYVVVVFAFSSVVFFTHALKHEARLLLHGAPEMIIQRVMMGRHELIPIAFRDTISSIQGVASVQERLWGYYYDPAVGANYTLMAAPAQTGLSPGAVIIGNGISRQRGIYGGDMFSFRGHDGVVRNFLVRGILSRESELVSSDLILMTEADFRSHFGVGPHLATDLAVRVRNPRELATIARKVSELLPDTRPIIRDEMVRTYDAVFDWRGGIMAIIFSSTTLAFVILAWEKASGLSAEERREIGILKAVGWETSDVLLLKVWEGGVISLTAFVLGVFLAYLHVFLGSAFLFASVLKGWSTLYPEFRLTPFIAPYQLAILFFLTVAPYAAATLAPSWRAAVTDPDIAMRS